MIMTWAELFRCIFYSFIYSLTNRQGSLPIDTLRQKSRFSGATRPPSQASSVSKKPLRVVRLSPIFPSRVGNLALYQNVSYRVALEGTGRILLKRALYTLQDTT